MSEDINPPYFLKDYKIFSRQATKERSHGRGSGGLMTLVKRNVLLSCSVLDVCNLWLFVELKLPDKIVIVGNVYWPPSSNIDFCIESLQDFLTNLTEDYSNNTFIIIMGDFNARVHDLNCLDKYIFYSTALNYNRLSFDSTITRRGRLLIDSMEMNNFILCNGRTRSDSPANYTYIAKQGCSVIDLVWTNENALSEIIDLSTNVIAECSSHLMVTLEIQLGKIEQQAIITNEKSYLQTIKWDESNEFYLYLSLLSNLYFNSDDNKIKHFWKVNNGFNRKAVHYNELGVQD